MTTEEEIPDLEGIEKELERLTAEEQRLAQRLAEATRALALQRVATGKPYERLGAFGWGVCTFLLAGLGSLTIRCGG
jgi:hypothetical protein